MRGNRLEEFLSSRIEEKGGCWIWKGKISPSGYGVLSPLAHRLIFSLLKGEIEDGLVLDHLCRNRSCCNPDHLEAVTSAVNVLRGEALPAQYAKRTHCKYGHPFDADNTYFYPSPNKKLGRLCKTCRNERKKRFYHKHKPPLKPRVLKTHCENGHEYTVENTYFWTAPNGQRLRYCIQCRKDNRQRTKLAK